MMSRTGKGAWLMSRVTSVPSVSAGGPTHIRPSCVTTCSQVTATRDVHHHKCAESSSMNNAESYSMSNPPALKPAIYQHFLLNHTKACFDGSGAGFLKPTLSNLLLKRGYCWKDPDWMHNEKDTFKIKKPHEQMYEQTAKKHAENMKGYKHHWEESKKTKLSWTEYFLFFLSSGGLVFAGIMWYWNYYYAKRMDVVAKPEKNNIEVQNEEEKPKVEKKIIEVKSESGGK